ncbi:hypothetical protein ACC690_38775, partial [Rhizobium johnstonii]|uniref:hypothetical protein n=1 Tax=Rhizobium johnstonii TaxID=3019933 RepID=UPI003F9AAE19
TNRLCLLGRPRLLAAGKELPLPENSYFLLAMLAAEPNFELDRETVRRQLWQSELPDVRRISVITPESQGAQAHRPVQTMLE